MTHFEGIVQVNGVDLYVRQTGHGPRLLVIHGGPDWDHSYLREYMSPLEKYAEVVFFDMRGCGRSQRLINLCDLHVSHVVEDVRQLMSYFGSEPWAVLGFSFGGRVGLEMVSQYPELVTRFILASSTAYPAVPGGAILPQGIESFQDNVEVRNWALACVDRDVWRNTARQRAREVIGRVEFSTQWLKAIQAGYRVSYRDRDYSHVLRRTGLPVLVLHGEFDRHFEVGQATRLVAEVPTSKSEIIRDAGHFAHMDAPEEWNMAIAAFVKDV